jgi:hypothetical protein
MSLIGGIIGAVAGAVGGGGAAGIGAKYERKRIEDERREAERARELNLRLYEEAKEPGKETLSPQQIAARNQLMTYLTSQLGQADVPDLTTMPSFAQGRDVIDVQGDVALRNLRGMAGLPEGTFAGAATDIETSKLAALSNLLGMTQEQQLALERSEDQRTISNILSSISLGTPRVNVPLTQFAPLPSGVAMPPAAAFWQSTLQGKGASTGAAIGGGVSGGSSGTAGSGYGRT